MRARFVFEKFTDDSDPIHDLGIGIYTPRSFETDKDLYEFLYDIMPSIFKVENTIDLVSKYSKLYFKGNVVIELKKYIREYVKMENDPGWWTFNVPSFHYYVVNRAKKEKLI